MTIITYLSQPSIFVHYITSLLYRMFLKLTAVALIDKSRDYRFYRNGNSYVSYVCNDKTFKELFTPTSNGATASVRYFLALVVLNVRLHG